MYETQVNQQSAQLTQASIDSQQLIQENARVLQRLSLVVSNYQAINQQLETLEERDEICRQQRSLLNTRLRESECFHETLLERLARIETVTRDETNERIPPHSPIF